jgi:hypothetical protein
MSPAHVLTFGYVEERDSVHHQLSSMQRQPNSDIAVAVSPMWHSFLLTISRYIQDLDATRCEIMFPEYKKVTLSLGSKRDSQARKVNQAIGQSGYRSAFPRAGRTAD